MDSSTSVISNPFVPGMYATPQSIAQKMCTFLEALKEAVLAESNNEFYVYTPDGDKYLDKDMTAWLKKRGPEIVAQLQVCQDELKKNPTKEKETETYIKVVLLLSTVPSSTSAGIEKAFDNDAFFKDVDFMRLLRSNFYEGVDNLFISAEDNELFKEMAESTTSRGQMRFQMMMEWVKELPNDLVLSDNFRMKMYSKVGVSHAQYWKMVGTKH
jgi:hypothetical protein